MPRHSTLAMLLLALTFSPTAASAETDFVTIRISSFRDDEPTITRDNLNRIKRFILKQGHRETYSNMYNDNPAYKTESFHFYLNPDTGQENFNCDPRKSDFHDLTIRQTAGGRDQYRHVQFLDRHYIDIRVGNPSTELTVGEIRQRVESALEEILAEIPG